MQKQPRRKRRRDGVKEAFWREQLAGQTRSGLSVRAFCRRQGLILRRSTPCDWIAAAADLALPLYERMKEITLQSHVLHTDDTTVKLLDPLAGQARTARFWTYSGDVTHPYTVYDFTDSRKRDGPEQFLSGYRGYLQADACGGYDGLFLNSGGAIVEVACLAHARRYWFDALQTDPARAHQALGFIARLHESERHCANSTAEQRQAARHTHALPILTQFKTWLDEQASRVLPKSPNGEAFRYTHNQWAALVRYMEDGALAIDNNVAERTLKPCALGRKNWLFVASLTGGRRAAILFSLIASAKANQVEPWAWLRDVFTRLPLCQRRSLPIARGDDSTWSSSRRAPSIRGPLQIYFWNFRRPRCRPGRHGAFSSGGAGQQGLFLPWLRGER